MNNKPLVSVLVPAYNHALYVNKTIESIINQTYGFENIQLLVIDDYSIDATGAILSELSKKHGFVYFQNNGNKGVSHNLNKMLSASKGKYICFCASDDYLSLDGIEKQVNFLENNVHYGMVYSLSQWIDAENNIIKTVRIKDYPQGNIFNKLFYGNFIPSAAVMIKKTVFDDLGGFDESIPIEDYGMWLKISNKYEIGFLNEVISFYRKHQGNTYSSRNYFKLFKVERFIINSWRNNINNTEFLSIRRYNYLVWIKRMLLAKDYLIFFFIYLYLKSFIVIRDNY